MVIRGLTGYRASRDGCEVSRAQIRDHRDRTERRPERSDPLTVGRPPASWALHRRSSAAELGGPGGPGRSAVKGGPEICNVARPLSQSIQYVGVT